MAPQPAFDGLQPKSDDLQLSCLVLLRLLFKLGWRVATATETVRNSISVCVCAPCSHRDSVELFPLTSAGACGTLVLPHATKLWAEGNLASFLYLLRYLLQSPGPACT